MSVVFSFNELSDSAKKSAVENVRKTKFYRFYVNGVINRYYHDVVFDATFYGLDEIDEQTLVESFLPDGGLDVSRFHILAEDESEIDLLLDLIFWNVEKGLDSIRSIVIDGGAEFAKTKASVVCDEQASFVCDGKNYTSDEIEYLFVQWFDNWRLEVVEKTKRVYANNMEYDSVVKYIENLALSFDEDGNILV